MTLIEGRDYHCVLMPFPAKVHEAIYWNGIDHYTIFLNENDSHPRRMKAFRHALLHILEGDFRAFSVQTIELSRHGEKAHEKAQESPQTAE